MIPGTVSNCTILNVLLRHSLSIRRRISRLPPPGGKPPLLPPARSKRYSVLHIPWQDPADAKELLWRRHIYNDAVSTYRAMYKRMNEEKMKGVMGEEAIRRREDEEFQQVLRANDQENRAVAERRKSRVNDQLRQIEDETLTEIDAAVRIEEQRLSEYEAAALATIDRSEEFITLENMEEKILEALENPKEYNHAVDLSGNVYEGDTFLKYLNETPLVSTPVSDVTSPLRKVGRYDKGSGNIAPITENVSASASG